MANQVLVLLEVYMSVCYYYYDHDYDYYDHVMIMQCGQKAIE